MNFKISQQYKDVHKRKFGKQTKEYCQDISSAPVPRQWPGGASKKFWGNSGSVCRAGTQDRPFVSHLWQRCGNELHSRLCTVLKQACQHQVMISRWCRHHPCCGHRSIPYVPAGAGSLHAPAALWPGGLCLHISGKRLDAPRARWCPPTPCQGGKLLRSQGLTCCIACEVGEGSLARVMCCKGCSCS